MGNVGWMVTGAISLILGAIAVYFLMVFLADIILKTGKRSWRIAGYAFAIACITIAINVAVAVVTKVN